MNLDQQVCSIELAKRLNELGVNKGSIFFWIRGKLGKFAGERQFGIVYIDWFAELDDTDSKDNYEYYSAYSVAELGDIFTANIISGKDFSGSYFCRAWGDKSSKDSDWIFLESDNEANARAKMLIHLIENKLIEVPK